MLTTFFLVVHTLIALALVGVILLQKSEGGGLGIGGGTGGGLMTARGAANLLTRSTSVLAAMFVGTSILLAVLAAGNSGPKKVDTSLARTATAPATPPAGSGAPAAPLPGLPGAPAPAAAPAAAPATPPADAGVPLAR